MDDAGFKTFVSEADMRAVLSNTFPDVKEVAPGSDEDLLFECQQDGVTKKIQAWKYTHPKIGELWVVNVVTVVDSID